MEYITKNFYNKLIKKISYLEKKKKKKIIKQLSKAVEKGDLSENYEYISAKEQYSRLILEINNLKKILFNSKVVNIKKKKKIKKLIYFLK
ncbi:MAG: hypothetical protein NHG13_00920 [Candidatus Shikimatogenerans bostrichidophilus]|nr:MAG: hypothetical protein NHG13_00920 [Candidatus Shikimatogenerans bostrichidophilus]